ncbi:aspartate aminotransferase family protein [Ilumatobacter coccineus]|uniref:alanine--glyoxylate transaminase n=1 Tax=Ilumatobacter coccineus (strain NBRC 103263 / KCTC 29153 / YM16-304) TaxID=1313172 RepID=A0A6C7E983_ILUCY|nr:aminotransferase [Ilumatobacter coccineus YM16-304]
MTMTNDLDERYRSVFPSWLSPLYAEPISIERGEGSYVWDLEGERYLDFFGGVLTTMIGHNQPDVTAAVQAQAAKVMHTSTLYLNQPMIELAEEIAEVSGIPDARVFFTASGSEANDTALLLATSYRKSNQVLAMRNSYHGRSFTTQAITSHSSWSSTSTSGLDVHFVQGGYRLRSPFRDLDDDAFTQACCDDLEQILDMTSAGSVAALIAEPIQGVGGFAIPPDGFFGQFQKILQNRDILFISDEVQTGWGRTGEHFWGYQAHGVTPDILTFAKGVGNGAGLAGVVARADVMDTIKVASFSTFGGNPLAAAAGLATLRHVRANDLQTNAKRMGERLRNGLHAGIGDVPWIGEVRGRGLMLAIETVHDDSLHPDPSKALAIAEGCKARGLLVGKGGLYGNVVRMAPMLNSTESEIDEGVAALVATIEAIA